MADNTLRLRAVLDDKVSGGLAKIRDAVDRLGGQGTSASLFGNIGAKAAAFGVGLVKEALELMVSRVGDAIAASSALSESLSKNRVVFGSSASDIERFGDTAASALGISKRAAVETAATFGNLFTGLDIGQSKAADMSKRLVTLASDLASFNNMDPTEVLDKLRSGLSGEAEPLRRVGVFLTEAKVRAKAMELGLADAHGELSEGAKVLARYQLILDETKTAQGDFARTAGETANMQRRVNAALEDAQARQGKEIEDFWNEIQHVTLFALDEQFRAQQDYLFRREKLQQLSDDQLVALMEDNTRDIVQRVLARSELLTRQGQDMSTDYVENVRAGLVGGLPSVEDAADALGDALPEGVEDGAKKAIRIVRNYPGQMAQALVEGREAYRASWETYLQVLEDAGDKGKQIARLKSQLWGDEIKKGLKSKNPEVRQAAFEQQEIIVARWQKLSEKAYDWGSRTMVKYIKGMTSELLALDAAAERAAGVVEHNLRIRSPAKKGPLSEGGGPEGWGKRLGEKYAAGLAASLPKLDVGAARFAGATMGSGAARLGGGQVGSSVVVHTHLDLDGREIARSVDRHLYSDLQRAAPTIGKV